MRHFPSFFILISLYIYLIKAQNDDENNRICEKKCMNGVCEDGLCKCFSGHRGVYCDISSCPNGCSGNGYCHNGSCYCIHGYSGLDCGLNVSDVPKLPTNHISCLNGCSTQGICRSNGKCACYLGFSGEDCSIEDSINDSMMLNFVAKKCPNDCFGHGECDEVFGKCSCAPDWMGEDCSKCKI